MSAPPLRKPGPCARRAPLQLDVRTQQRFSEPVEVAAYFVASEFLANAAKHSQASRITVRLSCENELLRLSVRDDGIDGADPGRGSGLVGLRDRVEALGGTLPIESDPRSGNLAQRLAFSRRRTRMKARRAWWQYELDQ